MEFGRSDESPAEAHFEKWTQYYAEASRRRRARGWHRRRHLRARRRVSSWLVITALLGLAAAATIVTLFLPR
jgi:hypothetical protein